MQANSDDSALAVTIVGGYLGSGKTTLINHVLNHSSGRKYAVLVNDFGELAIDAQLIESADGGVINLSGGCVCCSYGNDLTSAMMQLDTTNIDQVIIEASGVALPGAIAGSLSLLPSFMVSSIVVLADAATIESQAADRYIADTIDRQLASADLILLNKTDLLDNHQVDQAKLWLQKNYTSIQTVATSQANYPVSLFLLDHSLNNVDRYTDNEATQTHLTSIYNTHTLAADGHFNVPELAVRLADMKPGLLRVKGFVKDLDGNMQLVQIVGKRWTLQVAPPGALQGLVCIGLAADNISRATLELIIND